MREHKNTTEPKAAQEQAVGVDALVSHQGDTETASRWVWMIARLAMKLPYPRDKPRVGDVVVETTHLLRLHKHKLGLHKAVGELLEIDKDECGQPAYLIKSIDPEVGETWWANADITVIERCD